MADAKALFTQHFDAARTALTKGDKPAAAESLHWAIVAARSDPNLRRELASTLYHLGKLSRQFGRAGEAEAEQLLAEALDISEGIFGREHAALAPLLHELSRLHVQRKQHARAEDVLQRLLAIARLKGEENVDVAIALAAIAAVKRKLGDDDSAEILYRDALRIREKVLEPNDMVTVATLEQLSETCAARGNFAEALALLQRALPLRELAVGPGHMTVLALRTRAAELELQIAIAADTAAAAAARAARAPMPTPTWVKGTRESPAEGPSIAAASPIDSKDLEVRGEPKPEVIRPGHRPRERAKTPAVTAAVAAASLMASSIPTPSASQIVISPPGSARPHETVTGRESGAVHLDTVLADVAYDAVASADAALGDRQSPVAPIHADSPEPARKKPTVLYASAGVGAVAIAIAAVLMFGPSNGGGDNAPVSTETSVQERPAAAVVAPVATAAATGSAATGAAAMMSATRTDSLRSAKPTPASTAPVVQPEQRAPESGLPEFRAPSVEIRLPGIVAAPDVDSLVRSVMERPRASETNRVETEAGPPLSASVDLDEAPIPPKMIGPAPVPRFPAQLLRSVRSEGEVVVRFKVNELGNVDLASTLVERSDHKLFTAAVLEILPRFHFEPARTRDAESKPVAAWVSVPFRFAAKK